MNSKGARVPGAWCLVPRRVPGATGRVQVPLAECHGATGRATCLPNPRLLTVFGIYGVLAYSVSQQTQEIGIRMALGATPNQVVSLVMRNGMRIVVAGMGVGLIAFFASSRLLQSLLFGVSAHDPLTLLAATSVILVVGMLASYMPARRAARVSPVSAIAANL